MGTPRKTLDQKLISLRSNLRSGGKRICDSLLSGNFNHICVFCGCEKSITKEHILPRWLFKDSKSQYFVNRGNNSNKAYHRAYVPCCSRCNNDILGFLELYIVENFKLPYNPNDVDIFILWLEVISYKLLVHDFGVRYIKNFKTSEIIPYLVDFQLPDLMYDYPGKVLRKTMDRIKVARKLSRENSFVVFRTKNKNKHFFHRVNSFIFIEMPMLNCAVFYHLEEDFISSDEGGRKAVEIIRKAY